MDEECFQVEHLRQMSVAKTTTGISPLRLNGGKRVTKTYAKTEPANEPYGVSIVWVNLQLK